MNTYLKSLVVVAVLVFALASVPAQAVSVTFGGVGTNDSSGLTSQYGANASVYTDPGQSIYFTETFDGQKANGTYGLTHGGYVTVESGGWFTSLNEATDLYVTGTFGIRTGTVSYAARPGGTDPVIGDLTNYAFAPGQGGPLPTTVRVEYATDLSTYLSGYRISYLGLYYGSIDNYNEIAFYTSGNTLLTYGNPGDILYDGVITGEEILASQGGTSGNQYQVGSNVYVNLFFDPNEIFTAFELRTSGVAFEVDNIVAGVTAVPEPATLLLLGLGLVGLAGVRRKLS